MMSPALAGGKTLPAPHPPKFYSSESQSSDFLSAVNPTRISGGRAALLLGYMVHDAPSVANALVAYAGTLLCFDVFADEISDH